MTRRASARSRSASRGVTQENGGEGSDAPLLPPCRFRLIIGIVLVLLDVVLRDNGSGTTSVRGTSGGTSGKALTEPIRRAMFTALAAMFGLSRRSPGQTPPSLICFIASCDSRRRKRTSRPRRRRGRSPPRRPAPCRRRACTRRRCCSEPGVFSIIVSRLSGSKSPGCDVTILMPPPGTSA